MTKHKHVAHVSEMSVDKINAANSGVAGGVSRNRAAETADRFLNLALFDSPWFVSSPETTPTGNVPIKTMIRNRACHHMSLPFDRTDSSSDARISPSRRIVTESSLTSATVEPFLDASIPPSTNSLTRPAK